MSLLLYCIFRSGGGQPPDSMQGVDDRPVRVIEYGGLAAAVSDCAAVPPAPDPSRALAFAGVVEAFHRVSPAAGAIPMRYGAVFEEESQVARFLSDRGREHAARLLEVEGYEEMGLTLLPTTSPPSRRRPPGGENVPRSRDAAAGKAYLADRRTRYAEEERMGGEMQDLAERCRDAMEGLFDGFTLERRTFRNNRSQTSDVLFCLYFLVKRDSLPHFRRRWGELAPMLPVQARLSGPWPPYNFVLPKSAPTMQAVGGDGRSVNSGG